MLNKIDQLELQFERPIWATRTVDEIFETADLKSLQNYGEDHRIERKTAGIHLEPLSEWVCMWANTPPDGGIIVLGLEDDGTATGCQKLSPNQLNRIAQVAEVYCPDAMIRLKRLPIHNSSGQQDFLILIRVSYTTNKVVKTTKQKAYRRVGDSKKEIKNPEELRQLQEDKGEVSFEEEAARLRYPQDFNLNSITEFVSEFRIAKTLDPDHTTEDILTLAKLGKLQNGNFVPNVACGLLFANDPRDIVPGCRIRFLRFDGETEGTGENWNAVKDEWIDGRVAALVEQAEKLLKSQLREFSRLGKDGKFYTIPEYPTFAWYEAIVNACVHRSYGNGLRTMNIFVRMFDDRLEIESPGGFPAFVTPKNIYTTHKPRNPWLMGAMYYLKYVRQAHEGARRMRQEMISQELPEPEFSEISDGTAVLVVLRNNIKQRKVWVDSDVASLIGEKLAKTLSENEKRILNFAAEYGAISVSEAVRLTNSNWPATRKLLHKLTEMSLLIHSHRKDLERDPQARFLFPGIRSRKS